MMDPTQQQSSLLSLPTEIRFSIWSHILGNQRLHLYSLPCTSCLHSATCACPERQQWRVRLCQNQTTPHELQSFFRSPDHFLPDQGDVSWDSAQTSKHGYDTCDRRYEHLAATNPSERCGYKHIHIGTPSILDLTKTLVASVRTLPSLCRQARLEVNHIIYNTTIFSFWDSLDLSLFLLRRTTEQKRLLSRLELRAGFTPDYENSVYLHQKSCWQKVLSDTVVREMIGLRCLHLYLREAQPMFPFEHDEDQYWDLDEALKWFRRLRGVSLTSVTVVVSCSGFVPWSPRPLLTQRARLGLADKVLAAVQGDSSRSLESLDQNEET